MIPCLILGDSIAVGVGQARPECTTMAEVGITSDRYIKTRLPNQHAKTVVISLGVNDGEDADTLVNLRRLRQGVSADVVYWLLSSIHPWARQAAITVAREHRDRLIEVAPLAGADHLHPDRAGYAILATKTRQPGYSLGPHQFAYNDFPPRSSFYRDFPTPKTPIINIWRGPNNLNGVPVRMWEQR